MSKQIEDLTFIDDGMFQAVMHQPGISEKIIEDLLHVKVQKIVYPELEKTIAPFYTTKGVRLDVYLKDEDKVIDVELQSYKQDSIGKRTRYYQSMVDIDSLMKGQDYSELLDSYVLFICTSDPFQDDKKTGYGLPCYTFKNTCLENDAVSLDDKSIKVIYNASAYEAVKDEKLWDFLHFVSTNEPEQDGFSQTLADTVAKLKEDEIFRKEYAAMNLHDRDIKKLAKEEGRSEGRIEKAIDAAQNLYANGVSIEIIAKSLKMSLEQVREIVKDVRQEETC
jgi:predicted transposase/invertase (TIGR01784 family)